MSTDKKININDATEKQLRWFAEAYCGLAAFPGNTKIETIRSRVAAAWGKDEIIVQDDEENKPMVGYNPHPVLDSQQKPDRKIVRLIIQRTDEAGGDDAVPLGVNGRIMLVPRGKEVDIPAEYFEVLKNAVVHRYESLPDGGMNPVPRPIQAYPFQRIA